MADLTQEQLEKLATFDPSKPFIILAQSIPGFEGLVGNFIIRRPTVSDNLKINIKASKLSEGEKLDTPTENIAFILATFSVICTQKPEGFNFEDCFDVAPLYELFAKYSEWLELFRLKLQATQAPSSGKGQ